jgi:hypothetical protein
MTQLATQFHGAGTGDIRCLLFIDPSVMAVAQLAPLQSRSRTAEGRQAIALLKVLYGSFGSDVEIYLANEVSLPEFLLASYSALVQSFNTGATYRLRLFDDPDSPTLERTLFVGISTTLPVDEALARLRQFDEDWFLANLEDMAGRVNFTLDFA